MIDSDGARAAISVQLGLEQQYQVAPEGRPPLWVDGLDVEHAAIVEIVPVGDPSSWLLTPGNPVPASIVEAARIALDTRLLRLAEALRDEANPMTRLFLYTDQNCAVDVIADAVARTSLAARSLISVVAVDA